ncbi:MAG: class I SAM-dependent methyltransferase [Dehalococcoidia bacterium]
MTEKQTPLAGIPSDWNSNVPSTTEFQAGVNWAHDRLVEEPWVISKVRPGERILDIGSATSRYLVKFPSDCEIYGIDIRPGPPQPGVALMRGDIMQAPFRPGTFDTITCISTIEHMGCFVYGQHVDRFGDEVTMRHMRLLLRPGGRLLLTTPYGKGAAYSWIRIYSPRMFQRLIAGYRTRSVEYYRRDGERYVPCSPRELRNADIDMQKLRSDGIILTELTPSGGLSFLLGRISLRIRRFLHERAGRPKFWIDPA